ncbi:hypothetical protein DKX38_024565 [Salix brachista]|uniref:Uncharacterized protein n=1 Tax=Salix brachista TaxID=2182728 RepID=A0A5N5JNJ4_9ROSI|nr:hypothetical protein DKX38_024565 [Salix brachista]
MGRFNEKSIGREWCFPDLLPLGPIVHYGDSVKPLPRPLLPKEEGEEEVEKEKMDEEPVDHLSAEELLKRHVKHAKKVRARLREGRLKRIARYKSRLALLLPPQVEQFRNETPAEN